MQYPILYSFRRCPYAMRARLAINYTKQKVELREVVLKNKPRQLLELSAKATVPVLELTDGQVLEESLDIMLWALGREDNEQWSANLEPQLALINQCDNQFKGWLDKYKYADRFLENSQEYYRERGCEFLHQLEQQLSQGQYLMGDQVSLADAAIFPFVRQFAHVDRGWFDQAQFPYLQAWLKSWIDSAIFQQIMPKYSPWQESQQIVLFPEAISCH